jgi:phage shock protein PspC (stress-responsive transcriptional regulator)
MNKILNINLGGYALTIDDDAYEYLQAYLESIRRRFSESEGRDEIVTDIEARIGELIHQDMGNRTIVMMPDVEAAITIMGKPEDFGGEPEPSGSQGQSSSAAGSGGGSGGSRKTSPPTSSIKTGKRLFRDEEDSVVGGVCSGLAAYFGIQDPVWVRLIFVLVGFASFGFWAPAYILLWVLVPPAKSAADRLAMRGEPINVENIAREIEDGFERLSGKVNGPNAKSGAQNAMSAGVSAIGQVFGFVVKIFVKFWVVIALLIAVSLFIGLISAWVAGIWGLLTAGPFISYFSPFSSTGNWVGFANLFFLLSIPVVGLCLTFARALLKVRIPRWLGGSLAVFWSLNLISAFFLGSVVAKEYRRGGTLTRNVDLSSVPSDTLRVEAINLIDPNSDMEWWFDEEGMRVNDDRLDLNGPVEIRVRRSASGRFECVQNITARGSSREQAVEYASQISYGITTDGNRLRVPTGYSIPKGQRWRVQQVKITIGVPEGKFITFDDKIYHYAAADMSEYSEDTDGNYISKSPGKMFRMTADGLVCSDCAQFGDREYRSDEHYEDFILEGEFKTEIREGKKFKITVEGPAGAVQTIRTGRKITFTTNGKPAGTTVRVYVETPVFTSLHADNTGDITIRGFREGRSSISVRGTSLVKAYLDSENLTLSLNGKCRVELTGDGDRLEASLGDGATLEASSWRTDDADISASDGSKARIYARDQVRVRSDSSSEVKVDGNAEIKGN